MAFIAIFLLDLLIFCPTSQTQLMDDHDDLQQINSRRDLLHFFIDNFVELSTLAHSHPSLVDPSTLARLHPSFHPQTIQRIMHRVASRMPIILRVADVYRDTQTGFSRLKWSRLSGAKYFLSDTEYDAVFPSMIHKLLGRPFITSALELSLMEPWHLESGMPVGHVTSSEPAKSVSLFHVLYAETSSLLSEIHWRQRQWAVLSEEIFSAHVSLLLEYLRLICTSEGVTSLSTRNEDRAHFLAGLQPPPVLRVIDIKSTCQTKKVALVDYWNEEVQKVGFSAISHTYGMEVYDVFNCQCATESSCANMKPRCSVGPCPHDTMVSKEGKHTRDRVVGDILGMCENLCNAGVAYAWHDGVCICQHDEPEVEATIKCMGWVYAFAKETIIFLHYIGNPMAPIKPGNAHDNLDDLVCRWHTRVWTMQEAAVSDRRRYCVRVDTANTDLFNCQSLEEYEEKIGLCYKEESSKVEVIEEHRFMHLLWQFYSVLADLLDKCAKARSCMHLDILHGLDMWRKGDRWIACLYKMISDMLLTCFTFPTPEQAIALGSGRKSKHVGDHMNSILALTGVRDFAAPKDKDIESSTMKFFERQGQAKGLARALFSVNACLLDEDVEKYMREVRQHTWPPLLWKLLSIPQNVEDFVSSSIHFRVQQDGKLELTAKLLCLAVRFTANHGRLGFDNRVLVPEVDVDALTEFCTEACRGYLKMHTATFPHLSRFHATAPWSACCELGIGNVLMFYDVGNGQVSSSCSKCDVISSSSSNISGHLKGIDGMAAGDSFDAHFVIPVHHFRLAEEAHRKIRGWVGKEKSCYECKQLPMLIIQGKSLDDPVCKIGSFVATCALTDALVEILAKQADGVLQFPVCTFLDKIVVI